MIMGVLRGLPSAAAAAGATAGPWSIGVFILVGHVTTQLSGVATMAAVVLAATTAFLAAVCQRDLPSLTGRPSRRRSQRRDWAAFTALWMGAFVNVVALAAVARALSATMDYIGGGRTNYWVANNMGPLPDFLGGGLPDFVATVIVVVPSLLFICGMEDSEELRFILNITVAATVAFFLVVGGLHLDVTNWTQTDVLPSGLTGVLSGAALCSFGFVSLIKPAPHLPGANKTINGALWGVVIAGYCFIGIIVTLMAHYSVLSGSTVPLIEVFETRDVDWARIVMATLSTIALSLALIEVTSPIHCSLLTLAGGRWRLLPHVLTEEHPLTATPALVISVTCVVASTMSCLVPLRTLVQLMSAGTLIDNAFAAMVLLHRRYLPLNEQDDDDVRYQPLRRDASTSSSLRAYSAVDGRRARTVDCLKTGLDLLPRSLSSPATSESAVTVTYMDPDNISLVVQNKQRRADSCFSNGTIATSLSCDSLSDENLIDGSTDKNVWLDVDPTGGKTNGAMDDATSLEENDDLDGGDDGAMGCDGDEACESVTESEGGESEGTDIDAAFEEYKRKMVVERRFTFTPIYQPTTASARRVTCALIGLAICIVLSCASKLVDMEQDTSTICAGIGAGGTLILLVVITREPHNRQSALWLPLVPAVSFVASTVMVLHISEDIWPVTAAWVLIGCLLYWYKTSAHQWRQRASFTASHRERIHLNGTSRHSIVSTLVPSRSNGDCDRTLTRVDTLLIAR